MRMGGSGMPGIEEYLKFTVHYSIAQLICGRDIQILNSAGPLLSCYFVTCYLSVQQPDYAVGVIGDIRFVSHQDDCVSALV